MNELNSYVIVGWVHLDIDNLSWSELLCHIADANRRPFREIASAYAKSQGQETTIYL